MTLPLARGAKTRFHELAHVVLGHTSDAEAGLTDSELTPRRLQEVEAEAVALVCLEALAYPARNGRGATFSFGTPDVERNRFPNGPHSASSKPLTRFSKCATDGVEQ